MTYRELAAKITLLKESEMDSEVTFHDDSTGRYHPVSKLIVNNIDPDFPPLIYMEIHRDEMYARPI